MSKCSGQMSKCSGDVVDILNQTLEGETKLPCLQPCSFLLAWHGVLTLAFCGWPESLKRLKQSLNDEVFPGSTEMFGSRWPKMTLAAVRDDANLDVDTVAKIFQICDSFHEILRKTPPVVFREVSIVCFANKSLSRILARTDLPFKATGVCDDTPNSPDDIVSSVLGERQNPSYVDKVLAHGHRHSHYDSLCTETTLVSFVDDAALGKILDDFVEQVEKVAPNTYYWMPREARHSTLRSLHVAPP